MALVSTQQWESLERWSPTLFIVAGPLASIAIALEGINRFASVPVPEIAYWPLLPIGFALSLAGLVGLYPQLAGRAQRSATVGLGLGLFCLLLFVVGLVALLVTTPPGPYPGNLGPVGAPFFFGFLLAIPAIGIYGIAGLKTAALSRTTGALLVALALVQLVEKVFVLAVVPFSGVSAGNDLYGLYMVFGYSVPMVISMVAIGYSLRTDPASSERTGVTDATA